jgi:alkylated DNA nucleotide flippase Atl1
MAGKSEITPCWRVVGEDGRLNPKFPGGLERRAERLRAEGHIVEHGRKLMIGEKALSA